MTGSHEQASPQRPKRRRKLVRPDLQIRITLMTLSVCTVVLAIGLQLNLLDLSALHNDPPRTVAEVLSSVKALLLGNLLLTAIAVLGLSMWTGFIYSFKFCGPLYRFQRFFQEGIDGRWDQPCNLRKGDDLHDMKDSINAFVAVVTDKVRRQDELLRRVRSLLEQPKSEPEEVQAVLEEIEREAAECATRLEACGKQEEKVAVLEG